MILKLSNIFALYQYLITSQCVEMYLGLMCLLVRKCAYLRLKPAGKKPVKYVQNKIYVLNNANDVHACACSIHLKSQPAPLSCVLDGEAVYFFVCRITLQVGGFFFKYLRYKCIFFISRKSQMVISFQFIQRNLVPRIKQNGANGHLF